MAARWEFLRTEWRNPVYTLNLVTFDAVAHMGKLPGVLFAFLIGLTLSLSGLSDAQAKRLGGGGSFGGKSAFSSPYKRSSALPARSPQQQQATQQNQAAKQTLAKRGGLMGMLGGLAIGGLLGALLFGGAFENLNFMDILLFGGIAFVLYRLLRARAGAQAPRPAYSPSSVGGQQPRESDLQAKPQAARRIGSGSDTSGWFRGEQTGATPVGQTLEHDPEVTPGVMPAGFDAPAFLVGARIAFRDLQQAWDARDLGAIRSLTTDTMFGELQDRIAALSADNRTEVLKLDAELLDAREVGDVLEAVVLFDAVMREEADAQARQVREVWHFTKPAANEQPKWYLDGIQQLED